MYRSGMVSLLVFLCACGSAEPEARIPSDDTPLSFADAGPSSSPATSLDVGGRRSRPSPDAQTADAGVPSSDGQIASDTFDTSAVPLTATDLSWCIGACGGKWPVELGGWNDGNDVGVWGRGVACTGAVELRSSSSNKVKRLCGSKAVAGRVRICAGSCGGATPISVGGWVDGGDVTDIAYGQGCSGTLDVRKTKQTLICTAPPAVLGIELRTCNISCGTAGTAVGGWHDGGDIGDLAYGIGCNGALQPRQNKETFLCAM